MAVKSSPRMLHAPMPGGVAGATVAVEALSGGQVLGPPAWFDRASGPFAALKALGVGTPKSKWASYPVPFFLIHHPGVGPIVVDTGFHPSVATDPTQNLGKMGARFMPATVTREQTVTEQLRARGIDPKEVRHVILTHLHWDHVSAVSEFPQATIVVGDAEWQAAAELKRPWLKGYRHAQYDFAFDYRSIDFTRPGVASYSTFGRTFDLFGDGSVRVAFTPGHSPGHQSLILHLSEKDLVIAGDAVYNERHISGTSEPARPADLHNWRRSQREIQRFREQHPEAIIIPGHDRDTWPDFEGKRFE